MKTYFDKTCRYTPEAVQIHDGVAAVVSAIFEAEMKKGYSPREISHLLSCAIKEIELVSVLGYEEQK